MIHSILHQIWNQRRSNGWLFAELLIVFTLMWYCVDVLYGFTHAERQPKGYDLEHVYKIRISCNPTQIVPCTSEDSLQTSGSNRWRRCSGVSGNILLWRVRPCVGYRYLYPRACLPGVYDGQRTCCRDYSTLCVSRIFRRHAHSVVAGECRRLEFHC